MYAGLIPPMQSCFSDLVCQPLVTSYVIDAWSVWPCCTPGPWSTSTWCSASDGEYLRRQKRNGQLEKTREDANALLLWRSEIAMGHGAPQWFTWTTRWWWWWRMQWRRSVVKSDGGGHGSGSLRSSHQPKKPTEIRFRFRRRKWAIWSFSAFFRFQSKTIKAENDQ